MADKEFLESLNNSQLLTELLFACKQVEHEKQYGRWGDGGLEEAKRERAQLKRMILRRMERGNV